jgi:molybdopterin/thiamine biosynthesis adenylyltransferase
MPQIDRYARQTVLPMIGEAGRRRLAESTLLIVGCGALGGAAAELLARAGVGRLVLADRDIVEWHNLQRQLLFEEKDARARTPKAEAAAKRLRAINSEIVVEAKIADVTASNIEELAHEADAIVDGTDNFETRFLLNDYCVQSGKPWVYGGVLGTEGSAMAVRPGDGPCLRCVFPNPPGAHPTCETLGVLNAAVVWVASLQVAQILRILVGDPEPRTRLYGMDIWKGTFSSVEVAKRSDCPCCTEGRFDFLDIERGPSTRVLCGRNAVQVTPERPTPPNFDALIARLRSLGRAEMNGVVLEFDIADCRLIVFPDGRIMVMGTMDVAEARTLIAKYIGA